MAATPLKLLNAEEVAEHNSRDDCWVVVFGNVLNLTELMKDLTHGALAEPIIAEAGRDVSHWFNAQTKEVRTHVDPVTGMTVPYLPQGRFIHVPPPLPVSTWATNFGDPWWRDESLVVGRVTSQPRSVWVVNTLTRERTKFDVGGEERVEEIQDRYLEVNGHAKSYTWKVLGPSGAFEPLDPTKTLAGNGVEDDREELLALGLEPDEHLPTIHLYYNDDLTEA